MKNKNKIMFYTLAVVILILVSAANFASADLPTGEPITLREIEDIIGIIADFLIIVSMVVAVIFIILAGLKYITAGSDSGKVEEAKTMLKNGVIGAAVVLGIGVIIQTIAALVTRDFFN